MIVLIVVLFLLLIGVITYLQFLIKISSTQEENIDKAFIEAYVQFVPTLIV